MPIKFTGFGAGSSVTIDSVTALNWGVPSVSTIWDVTEAVGVGATINVRNQPDHLVTPAAFYFDLTLSGFTNNTLVNKTVFDPSFIDKQVWWDYGEGYTLTAPTQVAAAGMGVNSRYSRGPEGAHVFRAAGTYIVKVAVLELSTGKVAFGEVTLPEIVDADSYYSGSANIYVDATNVHANGPVGAQEVQTFAAAFALMDAATTPHRILFERGQTHTLTSEQDYRPPVASTSLTLRLEALTGAGAAPIIQASGAGFGVSMIRDQSIRDAGPTPSTTTFMGIDFRGEWDSSTETGNDVNCFQTNHNCANTTVVDDCTFDGFKVACYWGSTSAETPAPKQFMINDTNITNWQNYGILDNVVHSAAVVGCSVIQSVDALAGQSKDQLANWHGPIRIEEPLRRVINQNDLYSGNGWSPDGSITAVQPALRFNTRGTERGPRLTAFGNHMESARHSMSMESEADNLTQYPVNAFIEANIMITGWQGREVLVSTYAGFRALNNVMIFANAEKNGGSFGGGSRSTDRFILMEDRTSQDATNLAASVLVDFNALVNLTSAANGGVNASTLVDDVPATFDAVTLADNHKYQPNIAAPSIPYTNMNLSNVTTPRWPGYQSNTVALQTQTATPASNGVILVPLAGSTAIGAAASAFAVMGDFYGDLRPTSPSVGPFEVAE